MSRTTFVAALLAVMFIDPPLVHSAPLPRSEKTAEEQQATPTQANAPPALTNEDIRAKLIGNTISGVEDGEAYDEYLKPDGKISGRSASEKYTGQWRVADGQICFYYNETGKSVTNSKNWDCSFVAVDGSKVIWDPGPDQSQSTLVEGNPKGL
jgi:hypothetical protein